MSHHDLRGLPTRHQALLLLALLTLSPAGALEPGASMQRTFPRDWSFSDGGGGPPTEIEASLAKIMRGPRRGERIQAAALLWRNHSLEYAPEILALAEQTEMTEETSARELLKKEIEATLEPGLLRHELKEGDAAWVLRLAYLRPQPELAGDLLGTLQTPPSFPGSQAAAFLALGKTQDRRALAPLLEILKREGAPVAGFAAQALGDLGFVEAEPDLVAALSNESTFLQAMASQALGKIGTRASLSALQKIAESKKSTGVINTRRAAAEAVKAILKRTGS